MTAGTSRLRIFGLREFEYEHTQFDLGFVMENAHSVSEYLLRSDKRLSDGETIGVDGQLRFAIAQAGNGTFCSLLFAHLRLLPKTQ